jgi:signal transduction histidine kinase
MHRFIISKMSQFSTCFNKRLSFILRVASCLASTPMNPPNGYIENIVKKFLPGNLTIGEHRTGRLYVHAVMGMGFFGVFLFFIDLVLDIAPVAFLCLSLTVGSFIYLSLFRKGYSALSKTLAHLHVLLVILAITILFAEQVFVWTFIIPLTVSSMVVFTKKENNYSWVIIVCSLLSIPAYLLLYQDESQVQLHTPITHVIWLINLTGSLIFSCYIVYTLIRLNEINQKGLKESRDEIARQNKIMLGSIRTRDKLLSMMSHDVRGDIGKTIGVVDVIEQMSLSEEDKANLLHNLKLDAVKTLATLDNMLQWTRTQQDELNIHPEEYSVDRMISQLLSNNDSALAAKNIYVKIAIPVKLTLMVDVNMIDSVFRNLLGNAIKFTPVQGVISISAVDLNEHIEFTIQDSGVGMTPEQIDNIMKGVQFTTRGTNREKGRGFGMVLVTEFLAKHKSKLHIESTPGQGTCFTFQLPAAPKI